MPAIAHQNKILGNTSGGGSTIKVTTSESTLYGQTVTLTDGTTTMSGTFSGTGECEFTGVMMTGTVTASSGGASTSINVPYFGVYTMSLAFFSATITVTYSGGTCTCVGNGESYTASGSPYTFTVHGAATYTITVTIDGVSKTDTVTITTDGQTESLSIEFGTINVTYENDFRGVSITCMLGGTTITKTAPSAGNTMSFYPPTTGNWTISGTVSGTPYSTTANVTSLSTPVSVNLETRPDGSTATPTDVVQTWLKCAGINDKAYTTVAQVLADTTTLLALISDNNAVDYMVRSTTFASSVCANATAMTDIGANNYCANTLLSNATWASAIANSTYFESVLNVKVPVMTSNTTPSGECVASSTYSAIYAPYYPFDGNNSTQWCPSSSDTLGTCYIGYKFTTPVAVNKITITEAAVNLQSFKVCGSNDDGATWQDLATFTRASASETYVFNNANSYKFYKIVCLTATALTAITISTMQFYGRASS